jgi:NADPH:quinone reductase
MRAVQITELTGPRNATALVEVPEPEPSHPLTPGRGVIIDVRAAGVSFPEVLQTRGLYQVKPELPFIPGSEVAGVVRSVPEGGSLAPGDRVAAFVMLGAFAEVAVAPAEFTFPLPDGLDFRQGAGLILNYHTAYFALVTRGRVSAGETVLVHGAAGGIGIAAVQVAKGLGARVIAVVSSDTKERAARAAGADVVLRSSDSWKDQARELGGVDVVLDPVGGERFTDSLRSLRPGGRVVVVGFTAGSIPEVRVNRLLLGNTEVVGAGWGSHVLAGWDTDREASSRFLRRTQGALEEMIEAGHVAPVIGASFPLECAADALELIESRGATGKIVLTV